ncbi:hypothetical protein MIDIC_240058 [Alphaproteobacteria bacterium]
MLGGGKFIADAFTGEFPFILRKAQERIEHQAPHRAGRIKALSHQYEGNVVTIKYPLFW